MPRWMTTKEAAAYLGLCSHRTLSRWRQGRKIWSPECFGPKFISVNGRIFYAPEDLDEWSQSVHCPATMTHDGA